MVTNCLNKPNNKFTFQLPCTEVFKALIMELRRNLWTRTTFKICLNLVFLKPNQFEHVFKTNIFLMQIQYCIQKNKYV